MRVTDDRIKRIGELSPESCNFYIIYIYNDKKLKLPAGGVNVFYKSFIHSFDLFKLLIHSRMK